MRPVNGNPRDTGAPRAGPAGIGAPTGAENRLPKEDGFIAPAIGSFEAG